MLSLNQFFDYVLEKFLYIFSSGSCCLRIEYCDVFIAYIRDEEN
jgi:hypothetical protein